MVVDSLPPHAEFMQNEHWKDAPHFNIVSLFEFNFSPTFSVFAFKETSFNNIKGLTEAFAEMLLPHFAAVVELSLK